MIQRVPVVESLAMRARKATGLDREEFADLLGVSFKVIEGWERGRRRPGGVAVSLLRLIAAEPRRTLETLAAAQRHRAALRGRILDAVQRLGRGPHHTLPLSELRAEVSYRKGPGPVLLPGTEPEEIDQTLLRLEAERLLVLEPAKHELPVSERMQGIEHKRRGLLAFARPGPRLGRARGRTLRSG